jgi:small-conductance mechanosensitive channel
LTRSNPALFVSYTTIEIGSVFGLLAIVIGGAPLAWTIIRRTFTSQRKDLGLLFVPLISFLALVIYFLVMVYLAFATPILNQPASSTGHVLMWGLITIFIVGAIASTAAVWKLISRTEMEQETFGLLGKFTTIKLYEFAFTPAVVAALSMLVMFLATVIWGWLSYSLRPDLFTANMGVLMTSTLGSFAFTLITMVAAVIVAFIGVARGYSSRKAGSS